MLPFKHLKLGVLLSLSAVAVAVLAFATRYFFLAEYYPHLFNQETGGGDKLQERAAHRSDDDDFSFHDEGYQDLWRYCNFLENIVIGDEAASSEEELTRLGLKLSKVIVLFRHGARGPLRPMNPGSKSSDDQKVCDLRSVKATDSQYSRMAEELVQNADSLRPLGDRLRLPADFLEFPDFKTSKSDCQLARLTVLGLAQHIKLGYLLAGTYSTQLGLNLKSWREGVAVASTEFSRTFQSAVALLYGLTSHLASKEGGTQETSKPFVGAFPRHFNLSFGAHFCGPLESSQFCGAGPFGNKCPVLEKLKDLVLDQYDGDDPHHVKPELSKQKKKPGAIERATWDLLSIVACHRKRTPMPPDLIAHLSQRLNSVGRALVESEHYQHSVWLKGYGFIREVIGRSQEDLESSKLLLYSGHDITIEPLKAIFRLPDYSIPPYASRFIVEVFSSEDSKTKKKRYLRFLYNGVDVTPYLLRLLPPEEEPMSTISNLNLVELDRFERFVYETFANVTGTADYGVACKGEHLKNQQP